MASYTFAGPPVILDHTITLGSGDRLIIDHTVLTLAPGARLAMGGIGASITGLGDARVVVLGADAGIVADTALHPRVSGLRIAARRALLASDSQHLRVADCWLLGSSLDGSGGLVGDVGISLVGATMFSVISDTVAQDYTFCHLAGPVATANTWRDCAVQAYDVGFELRGSENRIIGGTAYGAARDVGADPSTAVHLVGSYGVVWGMVCEPGVGGRALQIGPEGHCAVVQMQRVTATPDEIDPMARGVSIWNQDGFSPACIAVNCSPTGPRR